MATLKHISDPQRMLFHAHAKTIAIFEMDSFLYIILHFPQLTTQPQAFFEVSKHVFACPCKTIMFFKMVFFFFCNFMFYMTHWPTSDTFLDLKV